MSTQQLQRVVVRMLYDGAFLRRVYDDPAKATGDCDLTTEERGWLREPDLRAWQVDPLRRSRSLTALIEEFAVSVAGFSRANPGAGTELDRFFSSGIFHRGMQGGDSLAALFAEWLGEAGVDRSILELEASLARVRRQREAKTSVAELPAGRLDDDAMISFAPAVEVLLLREGTVDVFSKELAALRQGSVVERALDPGPSPAASRNMGQETGQDTGRETGQSEGILVDGRDADPRLERLGPELAAVLGLVRTASTFAQFCRSAASEGADRTDCEAILSDFAADGLLRIHRP